MDYALATLYGIIQGLAEFLPISSSGHLALMPMLFGFEDPGVFFDLAMHIGTAMAVSLYFRSEIWDLLKNYREARFQNMVLATLTTLVTAFALKNLSEFYGRSLGFIAFNLAFFGLLMLIADRCASHQKSLPLDLFHKKEGRFIAVLVGLAQGVAIFPGVSRSGATLTMARAFGIERSAAAQFSFLLSLPIIFAGFFYELLHLGLEIRKGGALPAFEIGHCFLGIAVSFFVGLLTIHFFIKFITKIGLAPFFVYRLLLAAVLLFALFK